MRGDTLALTDGTFRGAGNCDVSFLGKAIVVRSLSGDPDACVIDCEGAEADPHRGFIFETGETRAAVPEGIGIRNGWAPVVESEPVYRLNAGALSCREYSPTTRNCSLRSNHAEDRGGAV